LVGRLDFSGHKLPASRRRHALRGARGGPRTVHLPRDVLLRLLLQGLHGPRRHHRLNTDSVRRDADHGARSLGGEVLGEAGRRLERWEDLERRVFWQARAVGQRLTSTEAGVIAFQDHLRAYPMAVTTIRAITRMI